MVSRWWLESSGYSPSHIIKSPDLTLFLPMQEVTIHQAFLENGNIPGMGDILLLLLFCFGWGIGRFIFYLSFIVSTQLHCTDAPESRSVQTGTIELILILIFWYMICMVPHLRCNPDLLASSLRLSGHHVSFRNAIADVFLCLSSHPCSQGPAWLGTDQHWPAQVQPQVPLVQRSPVLVSSPPLFTQLLGYYDGTFLRDVQYISFVLSIEYQSN